jgi:hypothetical protein
MLKYYLLIIVIYIKANLHAADFVYKNFDETTGLTFVKDAATSSCARVETVFNIIYDISAII